MYFQGLWSHTIGSRTSYLVDGMIFCLCFAVAIIYSGILGDIFTKLLIENYTNIPDYYSTLRAINIILITTSFILPMSIMKNLSSLSFTSFLGFVSILYTTIFICWRSLDGSYQLETGKFVVSNHEEQHQNSTLTTIIELPSFNNVTMWNFNFASLILISNYGLAYVAHYNAPIFYRELTGTNIPKFTSMVIISFIILIALYTITMIAGYKTFGDTCKGNILLNYHPDDTLSTVARIATGCSILFGYPLVMAGVRESLLNITSHFGYHNLCGSKGTNDRNHVTIVVVMLAIITFTSIVVQDISVVVGVTGAAMGSCIVYICPALIYTKAIEITYGDESLEYQKALWSLTLIPFGIIIAALGVYMSLREFF